MKKEEIIKGFSPYKWKCERCYKWNGIKGKQKEGENIKSCKCGRRMMIIIKHDEYGFPMIVGRSNLNINTRGTPKFIDETLNNLNKKLDEEKK
ncbi:MAG: hypothetical protein ACOCP8_05060 [archaeon]